MANAVDRQQHPARLRSSRRATVHLGRSAFAPAARKVPDLASPVRQGATASGGLFAGMATAARHHGICTVAVEPEKCCRCPW
ncbi:hypothetical protein [Streptomyces sp. NPDC058304]|uniref:hypothetical protein n=1 Tax=Streptomyces sp. NPDC058304 TaxID=3346437 RepID=UPI0036EE6550